MTKDELIHTIRMLSQGRVNYAQALADHLMPDEVDETELAQSTNPCTIQMLADAAEECKKLFAVAPETVDIEVEAPPPDPVKPKRKKG